MGTVDGIHFRIQEPSEFEVARTYSSHKYGKKAALAYEIAISMWRKKICHINGPFPAGSFDDLRMYREKLKGLIPPGKRLTADLKYSAEAHAEKGTTSVRNPQDAEVVAEMKRRSLARIETVNRLVKKFDCMAKTWRHSHEKHRIFFVFCIVVIQYNLDNGDDLFDVLDPP